MDISVLKSEIQTHLCELSTSEATLLDIGLEFKVLWIRLRESPFSSIVVLIVFLRVTLFRVDLKGAQMRKRRHPHVPWLILMSPFK